MKTPTFFWIASLAAATSLALPDTASLALPDTERAYLRLASALADSEAREIETTEEALSIQSPQGSEAREIETTEEAHPGPELLEVVETTEEAHLLSPQGPEFLEVVETTEEPRLHPSPQVAAQESAAEEAGEGALLAPIAEALAVQQQPPPPAAAAVAAAEAQQPWPPEIAFLDFRFFHALEQEGFRSNTLGKFRTIEIALTARVVFDTEDGRYDGTSRAYMSHLNEDGVIVHRSVDCAQRDKSGCDMTFKSSIRGFCLLVGNDGWKFDLYVNRKKIRNNLWLKNHYYCVKY